MVKGIGAISGVQAGSMRPTTPAGWNAPAVPYPRDTCVHQLIAAQAALRPNAKAVTHGARHLTYAELVRRVTRLARELRRRGVGTGVLVGICCHRQIEMVVGLLATLQAGAAYVPIDPGYPPQRLAAMMSGVQMTLLLTTSDLAPTLPAHAAYVVLLDREVPHEGREVPQSPISPQDLCYAVYTSGSTGAPKLAGVTHQGWCNLMTWFSRQFAIHSRDRVLVISSFSFDITQRAIVMALIAGGELHLYDSPAYDPVSIAQLIAAEKITLINCAPSTFYPLVEGASAAEHRLLQSLRAIFFGGESISGSRLLPWALGTETALITQYGTAECSDVATSGRLERVGRYASEPVPIGSPIANTQIYLLNAALEPVGLGEEGEICIAGDSVGVGYVNDPELTRQRFVPDLASEVPGQNMYRTGDLARFTPAGELEFIGRVDHQVKLRGYRIHLGDIEAALRQQSEVREVVVLKVGAESKHERLVSYLVPKVWPPPGELVERVRLSARAQLPEYMVPAEFVLLERLPLNPNGKVDRSVLSQPERAGARRELIGEWDVPRSVGG